MTSLRNRRGDTEWIRASSSSGLQIIDMWKSGEPVYRPDLLANDGFDENDAIAEHYGAGIRTVLDVPYLRGTIGVNSTVPNAFSADDQRSLCQLAEALSEGFQRLADIEQLDARDDALQRETAERRQLQAQLQQAQKMEAVGQLTAGVAHNFNNLLQVILGNLELCQTRPDPGELEELLDQAVDAGDRAAEIIRHLLVFSRQSPSQATAAIDVRRHVEATVEICGRIFDRRIDITCHLPTTAARVMGNAADVEQILLNLLLNARDALQDTQHPRIVVDVRRERLETDRLAHPEADAGDYICLSVTDNGPGISAEDQARLFEPFFTTKDVGQGTGLGLFTAYGIARQHGGWLESSMGSGQQTAFRLLLPAVQEEVEAPPTGDTQLPGGRERILIVDDEEMIRAVIGRILERLGYTVVLAQDGPSGVARYQEGLDQIDLVLLDLSMPQMSGIEVLEQIRQLNPDVRVIILTGYAAQEAARAGVPVVQKPVNASRLAQALRETLDGEPAR
ncbi:MAG: response regulator [Gemmatimonadetes bacterium]|nr:response regulator [Gemmatimonadota bacterium]